MCSIFFSHASINQKLTMPKKGCTYERVKGHCISAERAFARQSPKKKRGCTYGRNPKSKRCYSKKAFQSRMKSLRKKSAATTIMKALRKRSRSK